MRPEPCAAACECSAVGVISACSGSIRVTMLPLCSALRAKRAKARIPAAAGAVHIGANRRERSRFPSTSTSSAVRNPIIMQAGRIITSPNRTL